MDNETDIAIAVRDLTVRYKNGHTALHNASFSIKKGTISGLVGVNGAGKSTLFKASQSVGSGAGEEIAANRTERSSF